MQYESSIYILTSNRSCAPVFVFLCKTETKMGTYTMNYNLFMPSIGEQGWGELVNGNFSTIDTAMKGLDTRVGTLEHLLASFPSFVTKILRRGATMRANFCLD